VKLALSVGMNRDPSTAQRDQGTVDISSSPIVSSFGTKLGLLSGMIRNRPRNHANPVA